VTRLATIGVSATLLALACAGCGGEEDLATTGPGEAQVALLENVYGGKYNEAWADLHPSHQQIAPLQRFIRCSRQAATTGDLESIEVLDVFEDDAAIPAVKDGETRAVRLRITSFEGDSDTFVNHAVKVGDRWRWVLSRNAVNAYRENRCPR
jgi:hypothetical protein